MKTPTLNGLPKQLPPDEAISPVQQTASPSPAVLPAGARPARRAFLTYPRRRSLTGLAMALPATVVLLLMMAYPVIQTFMFSVSKITLPFFAMSFSGIENFIIAFSKPDVAMILRNTLVWTLFSVLLRLLLGLGTALVMNNSHLRGLTVMRVIALLPWTVPTIVSANTWRWIFQSDFGVINGTLRQFGLDSLTRTWLASPSTAMPSILTAATWAGFPFVMMMLLSAMQGLSKEHYEAASIDGANSFQLFLHITLPGIRPVLFIVLALETISAINAFDMIFTMTGGGPAGTTETLGLFVYRLAFGGGFEFGPASAVSVVMIMIAVIGFLIYFPTQKAGRRRMVK